MLQDGPIDCHAHVVPGAFPSNPFSVGTRWPCMTCGGNGTRIISFEGKPFRELDDRSWSVARRVETMDEDGIAAQLLSPMPELLSYWLDGGAAAALCDHVNGFMAEMVARAPSRFRALGAIPLQDIDAAIGMMAKLKGQFGIDGIQIGSNILGEQIGAPRFEPLWAAAAGLGLAVFVHALHPLGTRDLTGPMVPLAGFPLDTGQAAASLLIAGVMARHPKLRIGFSHGGGALASLLGRLDQGWRLTGGFGDAGSSPPSEVAATLFYDSNVYDPHYLGHLAKIVAPGQIFLGTDYPYEIMQRDPLAFLKSVELSAEERRSIERDAALRFMGI